MQALCGPLHLDEAAAPVVLGDRAEAGAPVRPERSLVPPGDPQPEPLRSPFLARVAQAGLDEGLREPVARQVRANAEADAHLVALAHEVEEADQIAVVVDHR